jgi:FkbH-like protein
VIESLDVFDQWTFSDEDRQRGRLYQAEARRRTLEESVTDLPIFYRQLGMKMTLSLDRQAHIARASQMTNRTNQFNMHTIRCSEDDIRRFMAGRDHSVITLALEDRFGDNGVVGLAVVRRETDAWVLHLFLMSCRVLGRTVEQTFVKWIAERAKAAGATSLVGLFAPTAKNKPFASFFRDCGFVEAEPGGTVQRWVWSLETAETTLADYIRIEVAGSDNV